jgi:hypothetical protein
MSYEFHSDPLTYLKDIPVLSQKSTPCFPSKLDQYFLFDHSGCKMKHPLEQCVVVIVRTDPSEQESVMLLPELEQLVPEWTMLGS